MIMMFLIIFLLALVYLLLQIRKHSKSKKRLISLNGTKFSDAEPTIICVFPDYTRSIPLQVNPGYNLRFHVRGFCDRKRMQETRLIKSDIEWQHQNYIGNFQGETEDKIKGCNKVIYDVPRDKKYKGKLVYITARYHGLKDSTWIKIMGVI